MTSKTSAAPPAVPHPDDPGAPPVSQGEAKDPAPRAPRKRGRANLERAHKTVTGMAEAGPGAPRSGSA